MELWQAQKNHQRLSNIDVLNQICSFQAPVSANDLSYEWDMQPDDLSSDLIIEQVQNWVERKQSAIRHNDNIKGEKRIKVYKHDKKLLTFFE